MKIKLVLYLLIFQSVQVLFAQTKVIGHVKSTDNNPLSFANVMLLNKADSSLVKGSIASENGQFTFENIKSGNYLISVSMVGYDKVFSQKFNIEPQKRELVIETLIAKPLTNQLNEITVLAKKPLFEQQIDRMVINVANSATASSGTALDVLERSPGITLNKQSNSLSMNGKSGVMVMLNGKLTRLPMETIMQFLEGINASNIEKIELITSPPARYDAEGDAGLINIITKQNPNEGLNGSFSGTIGVGHYLRPASSLLVSHRKNKLSLFTEYSFNRIKKWSNWTFDRDTKINEVSSRNDLSINWINTAPNHVMKTGFEYNFNKNTIIGGLISGFNLLTKSYPKIISTNKLNGQLANQTNMEFEEFNQSRNITLNLNLRHTFKQKQELLFDIDKLYYDANQPNIYFVETNDFINKTISQSQFKSNKHTPATMWVFKSDFTAKINKKTNFDTGFKTSLTDLQNRVSLDRFLDNEWHADVDFTQSFKFSEDIWAGYANFNSTLSAKTKLQYGVRYEQTINKIDENNGKNVINRNYGNLFPSVFFSHKLNKNQTLTFSYNRRITRPSYKDLASFLIFLDPITYFMGNPRLLPTLSENLQSSLILKEKYIFSLKYSYDKNNIALYQPNYNTKTGVLYYYTENVDKMQTVVLSSSVPINFTKWWQSQNNLNLFYQQVNTILLDNSVSRQNYYFQYNTSHSFSLPKKFRLELTYFYMSANLQGVVKRYPTSEITIGLQKSLPKGNIQLNINDIFWTNRPHWQMTLPDFNNQVYFTNEARVVRLTYNRPFGNQKVKVNQNRKTGSEEERQRF